MIVSNLLFDIFLFGALLVAAFADRQFPQLWGGASLIVVGVAAYIASQEWSDALMRRRRWTQESLSAALTLSTLGFIYYWWRNESDFSLLILSVALMMSSLMVAIATIAALGSAFKESKPGPILGWFLTAGGALALGVTGGVLVLLLSNEATPFAKVMLLGIGLFIWKVRETVRPPLANVHAQNADVASQNGSDLDLSLPSTQAVSWLPIPQRGTLLDRFLPVLIIGAVLFIVAPQIKSTDLLTANTPAAASNDDATSDDAPTGAEGR